MNQERLVKISKYLSKHLRHQPERLGLKLESGGWVQVEDLLAACRHHNFPISRKDLETVVANNDKQRFALDEKGEKIRANQGHSVAVDLQLAPQTPPALLFHGTSEKNVDAIMHRGLLKMSRHHVHLSIDQETARKVGARHGKPVIFAVETAPMIAENFDFFVSANNVWLVDNVPPQFLRLLGK